MTNYRYKYSYTDEKIEDMHIERLVRSAIETKLSPWLTLSQNSPKYTPSIYTENQLFLLKESTLILPSLMNYSNFRQLGLTLGGNLVNLLTVKVLNRFTKLLPVTNLPALDRTYLQQRFLTISPIQAISAHTAELDPQTRAFQLRDIEYPYHIIYRRDTAMFPIIYSRHEVEYYKIDDNQVAVALKHAIVINDILKDPKAFIRVPILNQGEPQ